MREKVNQEVSVVMYYSSRDKKFVPYTLSWQNKQYTLGPVDYYHPVRDGRTLYHVFELTDREETIHFKLRFNADNLHWILEAVHDGNPD